MGAFVAPFRWVASVFAFAFPARRESKALNHNGIGCKAIDDDDGRRETRRMATQSICRFCVAKQMPFNRCHDEVFGY